MARRKREEQPIGIGLTARQMKRRKPISSDLMREIGPLTENQKKLYEYYGQGKNIFAHGVPGSGKTFILLYNALKDAPAIFLKHRTEIESSFSAFMKDAIPMFEKLNLEKD